MQCRFSEYEMRFIEYEMRFTDNDSSPVRTKKGEFGPGQL